MKAKITFYKEEKFKDTLIGKIPEDWEIVRLEKICKKVKAGGTPLTSRKEFWNGKIPFVKIEDITSAGKYLAKTNTFISEDGLKNSSAWMVPEKSLLLAMYGSLGEISINKIPVATNQAILGIIPKNREDVEFLYYWYLFFKPNWKKYAKPTTQANLTAHIVRNSAIPLPSSLERKIIAQILSTVDEAIQKTNEIIEKTKRLKKGLTQELLTKGIGHKEFKDTEIGKIPKDWEIIKLKDQVNIETGKRAKGGALERGNVASIGGEHLDDEGNIQWDNMKFIPEDFYNALKQGKVKLGDILLVKDGATTGKVAILKNLLYEKAAVNEHVFIIRSKVDKVINEFLFYFLFSKFGQIQIKTIFHGMIGGITRKDIERILVPLPPLSEQQKIVEILSTIDKRLEIERKRKEKLERIKKALMDLLLTGKIRVKVS